VTVRDPWTLCAGETTGLYYTLYVGATSVLRGLVFGRQAVARSALNWVPKEVQRGLGGSHDESRCQRRPKRLLTHHEIAERLAIWCRSVDARTLPRSVRCFIPRSSGTLARGSWIEILRS